MNEQSNSLSGSPTEVAVPFLETELMACLKRQEQRYAAATAVIAELQQRGESGLQTGLNALQKHLANIRASGNEVQVAAAAHEASGQPQSPVLRAALAGQESRLKTFLEKINSLQSDFEAMKQRLQPQLDIDVTRHSMHKAYQRSMRTG